MDPKISDFDWFVEIFKLSHLSYVLKIWGYLTFGSLLKPILNRF